MASTDTTDITTGAGIEKGRGRAASRTRARILTYAGLVIASVVAVFPLLFMVFSSFKDDDQIFADLGTIRAFLPVGDLGLENYAGVFERVPRDASSSTRSSSPWPSWSWGSWSTP